MKDIPYLQQYKHPNWQKKRLEILQRDEYRCVHCQDENEELQVHHLEYERGVKVWDYPNENFVTLCKTCHEILTGILSETRINAAWEVYVYALQSLNKIWECKERCHVALILNYLLINPDMSKPVYDLLKSVTEIRDASKTTQTGTEG